MPIADIFLLFSAALAAGAINSVAGGGTFLTFPALVFCGYTPIQANISSTMALWPGSLASVYAYRREWRQQRRELPLMMILSVLGGIVGAVILLKTSETTFRNVVPWLLLTATLIFTFGRNVVAWLNRYTRQEEGKPTATRIALSRVLQFGIAVYGGYFGAGIGILMLAMLQLLGHTHIHRMNALKAVLGSAINAVAVIIFASSHLVAWQPTLVMLAGGITGGYFGAHFALRIKPEYVRYAVSLIGTAMTVYFFIAG